MGEQYPPAGRTVLFPVGDLEALRSPRVEKSV